jgi:hypothetical protein
MRENWAHFSRCRSTMENPVTTSVTHAYQLDYATAVVDPVNDETFWVIHEYADGTSTGWKTVVGVVDPRPLTRWLRPKPRSWPPQRSSLPGQLSQHAAGGRPACRCVPRRLQNCERAGACQHRPSSDPTYREEKSNMLGCRQLITEVEPIGEAR